MREEICIVLNEREPTKAKVAELLELRFKNSGLTVSRLPVDEHTNAVLRERAPVCLVLDYLLGDYTTGLDILATLATLPESTRPKVYFLTDEPSIRVAVEALHLGAEDYLEIDNPQAIGIVAGKIESEIARRRATRPATRAPMVTLDELVAVSPPMQTCLRDIRNAVTRRCPALILTGEAGVGLTVLARCTALASPDPAAWSYSDLATFLHPPADLPGIECDYRGGIRPVPGHTLIIDNVEADDGEVLAALGESLSTDTAHRGSLIVATTEQKTATAYARLLGGETIIVPPLRERRPDVSGLVQRFVREAEALIGRRIPPFDSRVIAEITASEWVGNVKQLRTVVLTTAIDVVLGDERSVDTILAERYAESIDDLQANGPSTELNPLAVAAVLEANGFHERRAAARLGCTLAQLRSALGGARRHAGPP